MFNDETDTLSWRSYNISGGFNVWQLPRAAISGQYFIENTE